jgi:hypothetical protein
MILPLFDFRIAGESGRGLEEEASDQCTHDAEHNVEDYTLACLVDDLTRDKARDQPEHYPRDN